MKYTLIIALALMVSVGCKKEKSKGNITFYQLTKSNNPLLYVDDERKGVLNKVDQQPVCGDNVKNKIITVELSYGEHQFWLDDGTTNWKKYYISVSDECKTINIQ